MPYNGDIVLDQFLETNNLFTVLKHSVTVK